jgi:DNA-directed RNA polymerase specialized sigma24 family protein
VVKDSRVIVESCILGNAEDCTPEEIADMFEVPVDVVRRILAFARRS